MEHQDWTTVTLKKKNNKPKTNTNESSIPVSQHINKQNKSNVNSAIIERKMDEGTFELPKVTHNLQQQLQKARQEKSMTQKELANKCNLTESTVKSYESGKAVPNQSDIDKMSKALGIRLKNK